MTKCIECEREYDNSKGGIMIAVCYECQKKPKDNLEAYVKRNGVLVKEIIK